MINFPKLNININSAKLNLNITSPQVKIRGNRNTFSLDKKEHKFSVEKKAAELKISNYPAYKQLGRKNIKDLNREITAQAKQKTFRAINEMSNDGDTLMKIESKNENAITDIAKRKHRSVFKKSRVGLKFFPKDNIKIDVEKGYVKGNYIKGEIKTRSQKNLKIDAVMGEVKTNATYPKVDVSYIGGNIDVNN